MKILGIIPARGGSKKVPRKNIRLLAGKPLISHTIEVALALKRIDRLIVSTDDAEIAKIAKSCGAEVPFMRPKHLADDFIPDQPVLLHVLEKLKELENYVPDIVLNLRPTTPLKTPKIINKVIEKIINTNSDIVRTLSNVEGVHHPYWMYKISKEGFAVPFIDKVDVSKFYQRQLLPPVYRINGVVDAIKTKVIYDGNILNNKNMSGVVISLENSIDIDNEFDFLICEILLSKKLRKYVNDYLFYK